MSDADVRPSVHPELRPAHQAGDAGCDRRRRRRGALRRRSPSTFACSGRLDLPEPLRSEYELRRHVAGILGRNESCARTLSFLGGGCWQHYVPAVCDEIANRAEFVTAYYGETYARPRQAPGPVRVREHDRRARRAATRSACRRYDWGAAAATVDLHGGAHHGQAQVALVPELDRCASAARSSRATATRGSTS